VPDFSVIDYVSTIFRMSPHGSSTVALVVASIDLFGGETEARCKGRRGLEHHVPRCYQKDTRMKAVVRIADCTKAPSWRLGTLNAPENTVPEARGLEFVLSSSTEGRAGLTARTPRKFTFTGSMNFEELYDLSKI
jgi:hypothetical protein